MNFSDAFRTFKDRLQMPDLPHMDLRAPIERLRQQFFQASYSAEPNAPELAEIRPLMISGAAGLIRARLYVPLGAGLPPGPGIMFFHGGGFALGDLDSHDMICRRLAEGSRCRVIAIDYRLAPEHKFPAAHDDALAAWAWLQANGAGVGIDPARTAVSGDSAGGNLAAYLAQQTNRDGRQKPAFQLLIYPLVQFADIRDKKMSVQESGFFISANLFEFFRDSYLSEAGHRMDVRISPLFAPPEDFQGLPPAHIILCGWDPLRDEGRAYATRLESLGVRTTLREYRGMVHGFMNLTSMSQAVRDAIREAGEITGEALGAR